MKTISFLHHLNLEMGENPLQHSEEKRWLCQLQLQGQKWKRKVKLSKNVPNHLKQVWKMIQIHWNKTLEQEKPFSTDSHNCWVKWKLWNLLRTTFQKMPQDGVINNTAYFNNSPKTVINVANLEIQVKRFKIKLQLGCQKALVRLSNQLMDIG